MSRAERRKTNCKNSSKPTFPKRRKIPWLQLVILLIAVGGIIIVSVKPNFSSKPKTPVEKKKEIPFRKEGTLGFYKMTDSTLIRTVDIEISETNYERARGLMHRTKMQENQSMLFIMDREEPQSFWMKSTHISLDILFLDSQYRVVSMHKYTVPRLVESLPSIKSAKYVVEVVAGFTDKYNINIGDYVEVHD